MQRTLTRLSSMTAALVTLFNGGRASEQSRTAASADAVEARMSSTPDRPCPSTALGCDRSVIESRGPGSWREFEFWTPSGVAVPVAALSRPRRGRQSMTARPYPVTAGIGSHNDRRFVSRCPRRMKGATKTERTRACGSLPLFMTLA